MQVLRSQWPLLVASLLLAIGAMIGFYELNSKMYSYLIMKITKMNPEGNIIYLKRFFYACTMINLTQLCMTFFSGCAIAAFLANRRKKEE